MPHLEPQTWQRRQQVSDCDGDEADLVEESNEDLFAYHSGDCVMDGGDSQLMRARFAERKSEMQKRREEVEQQKRAL